MALGNWGQQLQNAAGAFFGSDYVRDFRHASKTFRTDSYANSPKLKFLFHTYFDISQEAYNQGLSTGANFGLLVKDVKLPSYSFDTAIMNQYNRKRIVQTKIKYDPVTISFHDDNKNTINKLWYAYYTYYYKDGTKPRVLFGGTRGGTDGTLLSRPSNATAPTLANYYEKTTYVPSISEQDDWGYIGETSIPGSPDPKKLPFFRNITVFGFNQHNFTAYTLINPIITQFAHDTYDYDQGNGTMRNTMTIDYETVVYNEGALDGRKPSDIVTGFGLESNYDRSESPITKPGSNGTILGQGGLIDGVGGFVDALKGGNILGAAQIGGSLIKTFDGGKLKDIAKLELEQGLSQVLQSTVQSNRNNIFDFFTFGQTPTTTGTAGTPTANSAPTKLSETKNAGTQKVDFDGTNFYDSSGNVIPPPGT